MADNIANSISQEDIQQYHEKGFFVLKEALSAHSLELLRNDCDTWIDHVETQMNLVEHLGCIIEPAYYLKPCHTHCDLETFVGLRFHKEPEYWTRLIESLAKASNKFLTKDPTMMERLWMFNDQYIVKPSTSLDGSNSGFGWHQDSGYFADTVDNLKSIGMVSCWIALDDMNLRNGALKIQPYTLEVCSSFSNDLDMTLHHFNQKKESVSDKSIHEILHIRAGSIVWISPFVWHCSESNRTNSYRRAFMPQFTSFPDMSSFCKDLRLIVEIKL